MSHSTTLDLPKRFRFKNGRINKAKTKRIFAKWCKRQGIKVKLVFI